MKKWGECPGTALYLPVDFCNRLGDQLASLFVIGHRGTARLDHLLLTIKSIAGQSGVPIECIIVEQSFEPQIQKYLPLGCICRLWK